MATLQDRFRKLSQSEQHRITEILRKITERGFTPFPASEVREQVANLQHAWGSAAIEGIETSEMEKVLDLKLVERRIPSDAAIDVLLDDVAAHPTSSTIA